VQIDQDVLVYAAEIAPGVSLTHSLSPGRSAWVQIVGGEITLNGRLLRTGNGAAVQEEPSLELAGAGLSKTELLLFDLA
jgi:redox-sensitive bicupin YhaK (pirin superfamily)